MRFQLSGTSSLVTVGAVVITVAGVAIRFGGNPDLSNVAWGAIGAALVTSVLGVLIKSGLDADIETKRGEIQQQVNAHKHELDKAIIAAELRVRMLMDFYGKLWELAQELDNKANRAYHGFYAQSDFADFSADEAKKAIEELRPDYGAGRLTAAVGRFLKADNDGRNRLMQEMVAASDRAQAWTASWDLQSLVDRARPYLPADVVKAASDMATHTRSAILSSLPPPQGDLARQVKYQEAGAKKRDELLELVRSFLSKGDG